MRNFNITKIDSKGRVLIPFHIREYLGLEEGMELMVVNNGNKELKIFPLFKGKCAEVKVLIKDSPGALAKTSEVFAKHKADILMSQSKTLEKGKLAEWSAILDISECDNLKKLKDDIKSLKIVKNFEFLER